MASVAVGYNNGIGNILPPSEILFGDESKIYKKIQIGQVDILQMMNEITRLRDEVDFLKSALHRVLAEESYREVEEILCESNSRHHNNES